MGHGKFPILHVREYTIGRAPLWAKILHQNQKVVSLNPNGQLTGLKGTTFLQIG